jgi:hypoxanthine-guanine phosphoribosyltransferase
MKYLLKHLNDFEPASIKVAIAFHKKVEVNIHLNYFADYIGFLIPNYFVIGFGLDYNEKFRELPHLCKINKHGIETFKTE